MNKIAIVGHPSSGYTEVLALLQRSGMAAARPSKREGLLPRDINATLIAAHKVPPVSSVLDEEGFAPIETGAVWHGMALDLMLGNLDEPLWGWADPHAIYALDYWKELDPQLTFVLVYDEPHRVLMDAASIQGSAPGADELHRLLDNWTAYNSALLRFYLRHPERSVLVHAQQARHAADTYLQWLQPLLNAPLSLPELDAGTEIDREILSPPIAPGLPTVLSQAVAVAGTQPQEAAALLAIEAAERYVVDGVLATHRRALQLHAELQSAASLPLDRHASVASSATAAWEALVSQRNFWTSLLGQICAKYQAANEELKESRILLNQTRATQARENERLSGQMHQLEQALDAEKLSATRQRKEWERDSSEYDRKLEDSRAENDLLLNQLHQVQEHLEQVFLRKQKLEQRDLKITARNKVRTERARRRVRSLIQRLHNAKQRVKSEVAYEAERVRQDIAYRLGEVVVQHGKTPWGWLVLPFALSKVAREYRKQRRLASG